MKSIYARKQVELFLDEEERSIQEEPEQGENKIEGDGNNTPTQRRLGLDIGMIGAREETLGRTRSQTQVMSSPIHGKSRPYNGGLDSRKLPDLSSDFRTNRTEDISRGMAL